MWLKIKKSIKKQSIFILVIFYKNILQQQNKFIITQLNKKLLSKLILLKIKYKEDIYQI